jgi:pimeloyl-ACP methyl ester carboxylesterase
MITIATLSYDRLGVGNSSHPDGIQTVQQPYEIAESVTIAGKLRDGSIGNGVPTFSTVVGVGHSYGSNLLAGVAATAPNAFDILVLTGFSGNATSGTSASYATINILNLLRTSRPCRL